MNILSAKYANKDGAIIEVVTDDGTLYVPEAEDNGDYAALATWVKNGGKIEPYVAAIKETETPVLSARQFWQAALVIGVTEEGLANDVSSPESTLYVADDEERESVLIDIKKTTQFSRDHYLVEKMAKAKDIETEQLDSLWQWASNIQ